jgi:hypothetical protein
MYNVILRHVCETIVALEKQQVLRILCVLGGGGGPCYPACKAHAPDCDLSGSTIFFHILS